MFRYALIVFEHASVAPDLHTRLQCMQDVTRRGRIFPSPPLTQGARPRIDTPEGARPSSSGVHVANTPKGTLSRAASGQSPANRALPPNGSASAAAVLPPSASPFGASPFDAHTAANTLGAASIDTHGLADLLLRGDGVGVVAGAGAPNSSIRRCSGSGGGGGDEVNTVADGDAAAIPLLPLTTSCCYSTDALVPAAMVVAAPGGLASLSRLGSCSTAGLNGKEDKGGLPAAPGTVSPPVPAVVGAPQRAALVLDTKRPAA